MDGRRTHIAASMPVVGASLVGRRLLLDAEMGKPLHPTSIFEKTNCKTKTRRRIVPGLADPPVCNPERSSDPRSPQGGAPAHDHHTKHSRLSRERKRRGWTPRS